MNRHEVAERLTTLLGRFEDPQYGPSVDGDDELLGSLLTILYPAHVSIDEILPHIHRRRSDHLIGNYYAFLFSLPDVAPVEDFQELLRWMATRYVVTDDEEFAQDLDADTPPPDPQLDESFVSRILDKALVGPHATENLESVAAILFPLLMRDGQPALPLGLLAGDERGRELESTRELRRALAKALVDVSCSSDSDVNLSAWNIVAGWSTARGWVNERYLGEDVSLTQRRALLDHGDLRWVYRESSSALELGNDCFAQTVAAMSRFVFDPDDGESVQFVFENQEHLAWRELGAWFQPIPLNGEYAQMMRRSRRHERSTVTESERIQQHIESLLSLMERASNRDSDAFWQLALALRVDPRTNRQTWSLETPVRDLPGFELLGSEALTAFESASAIFLETESDYSAEWIGSRSYDRRAIAGYIALSCLKQAGLLDRIPDDCWSRWVGACLWVPVDVSKEPMRVDKQDLLRLCAEKAPAALAQTALLYARRDFANGGGAYDLRDVPFDAATELGEVLFSLLDELYAAWGDTFGPDPDRLTATDPGREPANDEESMTEPPARVILLQSDEARASAQQTWVSLIERAVSVDPVRATEKVQGLWRAASER